jgi:hypothetical protein
MNGNQLLHRDVLDDLQGKFTSRGSWVELHGCNVGQGTSGRLLTGTLAQLWQVPVAAGTVTQYTSSGFETAYIVAHPSGKIEERTGHHVVTDTEAAGAGGVLFLLSPVVGAGVLVGTAISALIRGNR